VCWIFRFDAQWLVTDFKAGDALFFTMKTLHMSTKNVTNLARVSCDTRWQLGSAPADPRYVKQADGQLGHTQAKFGVYADTSEAATTVGPTIEEKKAEWGFSPV
jgi:ectoine hydroxylase-related dioxygenase (phytanoyl-CoA dioxygenase family)